MDVVNIGLTATQRDGATAILNRVLSTESILMIKTKRFHWTIVGPQYASLHSLLDRLHREMSVFADRVAERILSLGRAPIGTAAGFIEHSAVPEAAGDRPSAIEAVGRMVENHESLVRELRAWVDQCESLHDRGTEDLLVGLLKSHEHMVWMLRSFLEGERASPMGQPSRSYVTSLA